VGMRVLDLSRLMPFSYASQLLVDAGAEVVKVEAPGGEYGRGMGAVFALCNRGKRSITLDLRAGRAQDILRSIVRDFDVLLESFRPGYLTSLGLGYESLQRVNPSLVYCSATGYGATGPYADRPGHDLNYAAVAGLLSPDGEAPVMAPVPYVDMAGGLAAAFAIVTAFTGSRLTGQGRWVEVGMADVAVSFNLLSLAMSGVDPPTHDTGGPLAGYPWPALMRGECPCYGLYTAADGRIVALANVEPKFWEAFLGVLQRPDLAPHRFATGDEGARVRAEIASVIGRRSSAAWIDLFEAAEVCFAVVNSAAQVEDDPHVASRRVVRTEPDGTRALASPARFDGAASLTFAGVPDPGQHNVDVLGASGFTLLDLQAWERDGVI
jgi:alpha-methylacyl-CoA racemase